MFHFSFQKQIIQDLNAWYLPLVCLYPHVSNASFQYACISCLRKSSNAYSTLCNHTWSIEFNPSRSTRIRRYVRPYIASYLHLNGGFSWGFCWAFLTHFALPNPHPKGRKLRLLSLAGALISLTVMTISIGRGVRQRRKELDADSNIIPLDALQPWIDVATC